jgi:hypothetical protein
LAEIKTVSLSIEGAALNNMLETTCKLEHEAKGQSV